MDTASKGSERNSGRAYEAPVLVPIGSLHDLLAGGGSLACDNGELDPTNGGKDPFAGCGS